MRRQGARIGWLLGLLAAPALALGAGTATIQSENQTLAVAWEDADTARVDPQDQPAYMIVRDGKLYTVSSARGRTMVMDMSAMGAMMGRFAGQAGGGGKAVAPGPQNAAGVKSINPTGRSEVVAGIEGEVYEIHWQDSDGQAHTDEAVLSDDPRVVELLGVVRGIAASYAEAMDQDHSDRVGEALAQEGMGILRYSDRMRVTAISGKAPSAGTFELPAEPMDPSGMGGMGGRP